MKNNISDKHIKPTFKTILEKKFIGKSITMSLTDNKTFQLFRDFIPNRNLISNAVSADIFDIKVYPLDYYTRFDPVAQYEKWALLEVPDFSKIPNGMKPFSLEGGLYAIFHYKGLNTDTRIFQYIFKTWLPNSNYELDSRPHFEILGVNYRNNDPHSEEDIYIPVKLKP